MDNTALISIIVILAIVIVAGAAYFIIEKRRTEQLRTRFGPEYDRTVKETGKRSEAEASLEERAKRVEHLKIRPLTREESTRFTEGWKQIQSLFVDDPKAAVTQADHLLGEVMSTRGYPVADFNQRAADISVDHPRVVDNYRAGHEIALRHAQGKASTEDLRQAMIHYRTLFNDLVEREMTTSRILEQPGDKEHKKVA